MTGKHCRAKKKLHAVYRTRGEAALTLNSPPRIHVSRADPGSAGAKMNRGSRL
jgi:hypothetical protein